MKDKNYFIEKFSRYCVKRETLALNAIPKRPPKKHFFHFSIFGRFRGFNAEVKIQAAYKMSLALQDKHVVFKHIELAALRHDRLNKITAECEKEGLLPEAFITQEQAYLSRPKIQIGSNRQP